MWLTLSRMGIKNKEFTYTHMQKNTYVSQHKKNLISLVIKDRQIISIAKYNFQLPIWQNQH